MALHELWERHARAWIAWARAPDHDGFWEGTWPELRAVLPPEGAVIEIGCGEGRVLRELSARGHFAIGIERSPTLVRAARAAEARIPVVRADAARLPFADAVTDVVVACMSLHDVDDAPAMVHEASRVLRPGGSFCAALVHPFASSQDPATMHTYTPQWTEPYLRERRVEDHVERNGLEMSFVSTHRPLSSYVHVLGEAGLVVTQARELGNKPIPWLLVVRADRAD